MLQTMREIMEAVQLKPQEQVHEHVAEEIRVPVPRVTETMIEVVKHTPREWLQRHTVE